jgi:hypothetical protein
VLAWAPMANPEINSFEDFWPYYVRAHQNKNSRRLHFVGTSAAMTLVGLGVLTRKITPILLAPVAGYGMAWIGHFLVEGNTPATFGHPLWSLKGDFKMWRMILEGTMDAEVERVLNEAAAAHVASESAADAGVPVAVPDTTVN